MVKRPPTVPPPIPADRVSSPIDAEDLFPEPPEDATVIVSTPFDLKPSYSGRDDVLEALGETFDATVSGSEVSFSLLVGEPGMGKSHTASEFARWVRENHAGARFLRGRADGNGVPYAAFARLLAKRFALSPSESADERRERIIAHVSDVLPAARVTEVAHLLAHLCRIPFPDSPVVAPLAGSPQQLETRTFIALRRFIAADAKKSPVVLCIENLDECGPESINLIHYLVAGLAHSPVAILGTARATVFKRYPSFGESETPLQRIELGPLSEQESEILVRALCRQLDHIPDKLIEHAKKLGGSPRAVLELIRLMLESEVIVRSGSMSWQVDVELFATLKLPASHEDLVAERVRVMAGVEADVLEKAAAVGETFWLDAVVAAVRVGSHRSNDPDGPTLAEIAAAGDHTRIMVAQSLQNLVEREWLVEVAESSMPGEREYRFAYPYLWSCVYEGTDDALRRAYHQLTAQWLDLRPAGDVDVVREDIGRHLELAGNTLGAAQSYRQAADSARAQFQNTKAKRLYAHALACLGEADLAHRIQLWHDLGSVYELTGDFEAALGAFERMLRLAWTIASRTKAAVAFNKMGRVWRHKGDLALALEYLERGQELFEQAHDAAGIAGSLDDTGQVLYLLGRYDEAFDKVTEGLARRGKRGDQRSIAHSLSNLGNIQKDRGHFEEALNCHTEALEIRRAIDDRAGVTTSLNNLAVLAFERGDLVEARNGWRQTLSEAEDIGALPLQALALTNLGELALAENHYDEARRRLEEAREIANDIDDPLLEGEATRNMAMLEHTHGDAERARDLAMNAYEIATTAGLRDNQGRALLTLGEVYAGTLFDAGQVEETPTYPTMKAADRYYSKGVDLLRDIGNESELAKGLELFGRYKVENHDLGGGRKLLEEARDIFKKLGMKQQADVEEILAALG